MTIKNNFQENRFKFYFSIHKIDNSIKYLNLNINLMN